MGVHEYELEILEHFFWNNDEKLAVVTGQKGMGKTTMLREFAKDKANVFFTAAETTDEEEIVLLARTIGWKPQYVYEPFANRAVPKLTEIFDELTSRATKEPLLFVIDHYPYFVKADDSFEKTLYDYVKNQWKDLPIKLVLCGDSFLAMKKQVAGPKSVWKNEKKCEVLVGALDFYEAMEFYADKSPEEKLFSYGITGGIPYQLKRLGDTMEQSAYNIALTMNEGIHPDDVMSVDLRELSYYNRMLSAMANGNNRVNQISGMVNKPKDVVVPYLNTLMALDVVTKQHTITEKTNRKKTRYSIVNTNTIFWYQFVATHMELYFAKQKEELWNSVIKPNLSDYLSKVFIEVCKAYLKKNVDMSSLGFKIEEVGNWWENDDEAKTTQGFDLVALGESNGKPATAFGRCYYNDEPIDIATLKELIEMTKHLKREGDVYYLVFSKSGFHENTVTVASAIKNIILLDLNDICK